MPGWIIAAGLGSIALTALLTFVLWRLNAPTNEHVVRGDSGGRGDGAVFPIIADSGGDHDSANGTSDGGSGGDGGGGGGGGK